MSTQQQLTARKLFAGWMYKKGNVRKSWKKRWFVLLDNKELKYYEKEDCVNQKGVIDLSQVVRFGAADAKDRVTGYDFMLNIVCSDRSWLLAPPEQEEMDRWLMLLEKIVVGLKIYSGWLVKRGAVRKNWKRRYFVVRDNRELKYYEDETCETCFGSIDLTHVLRLEPDNECAQTQAFTINMITKDRTWFFAAGDEDDQDKWIHVLELAIGGAKRLITTMEGFLTKRGHKIKSWKQRYFVLSRGWLFYFAAASDCKKFKDIAFFSEKMFNEAFNKYVKGSIPLDQARVEKVGTFENRENCFTITTPRMKRQNEKVYYISAESEQEMNAWLSLVLNASGGRALPATPQPAANQEQPIETHFAVQSPEAVPADEPKQPNYADADDEDDQQQEEQQPEEAGVAQDDGSDSDGDKPDVVPDVLGAVVDDEEKEMERLAIEEKRRAESVLAE